jgi:hypothetical protein
MYSSSVIEMAEERKAMLIEQLAKLSARADLLQRSLTVFYLASGGFVASSVAIGLTAILRIEQAWLPVALGLLGACFLFYGSVMLIREARLAVSVLRSETSFLHKLVTYHHGGKATS